MPATPFWQRLAFWLPGLLLACGGQTCGGCNGPLPPPQAPAALLTPQVVQARITQHGFNLIASHLVQLLQAVLGAGPGGVAVIDVAKVLGPQPLQFAGGLGLFNGQAGVRDLVLTFDVLAATVKLVDGSNPARIQLSFDHARIGVQKGVVFGAASVIGFDSDAACHLKNGLGTATQTPHMATFSGTVDLVLGVDAQSKLAIQVEVSKPVLHSVGFALQKDCGLGECTDQFLLESPCLECELCATGQLASDAINATKDLLGPLLTQLLQVAGNLVVKQVLNGAINGKPLDIEVSVDLKAILQGVSPFLGGLTGDANVLRLRTRPSPQAFIVQGAALQARLDAAVFAQSAACVVDPGQDATTVFAKLAQSAPPALPATMLASTKSGDSAPKDIDVAVLLGRRVIEEAAWSVVRSGLLCVAIDTGALYQVSAGKLLVTAGALDLALPGITQFAEPDAPIRLAIRPNARPEQAPMVQLQQEATATVATVRVWQLGIGIEAFVHGRWLTLVEMQADADAVLAISVLGPQVVVTARKVAIPHVVVVGDPVAPGANWQALAPAVAQMAVTLLLAQPLQFDVDVQAALQSVLNLPLSAELIGLQATGADNSWLLLGVALHEPGAP